MHISYQVHSTPIMVNEAYLSKPERNKIKTWYHRQIAWYIKIHIFPHKWLLVHVIPRFLSLSRIPATKHTKQIKVKIKLLNAIFLTDCFNSKHEKSKRFFLTTNNSNNRYIIQCTIGCSKLQDQKFWTKFMIKICDSLILKMKTYKSSLYIAFI